VTCWPASTACELDPQLGILSLTSTNGLALTIGTW